MGVEYAESGEVEETHWSELQSAFDETFGQLNYESSALSSSALHGFEKAISRFTSSFRDKKYKTSSCETVSGNTNLLKLHSFPQRELEIENSTEIGGELRLFAQKVL